jgi:hypothetical protein
MDFCKKILPEEKKKVDDKEKDKSKLNQVRDKNDFKEETDFNKSEI